jgi:hypothetical protein
MEAKHGDVPVFRYASQHEYPKQPHHPEINNIYLEAHKETPQMFGYPVVIELK